MSSSTPTTATSSGGPVDLAFPDRSMESCERAMLALQSKTIEALTMSVLTRHLVTQQMRSYLARLKLDVDKLRVIHVAGTKGKGSTSAFTERILREHGLQTALYSSPHLVHLTERFRINGAPISEELFLKHFWCVWDGLVATKGEAGDYPPIPSYFRYLTLVAYHLFLHHTPAIDAVVLEVGMGGKLDATNIVAKPVVCGISSIGYDHMEILGYTLTEIAGEKAGIIKPGVPVYTPATQAQEVKTVFEEVAKHEGAKLSYIDPLDESISLGLAGEHQRENAALACALAKQFLGKSREFDMPKGQWQPEPYPLNSTFREALSQTSWPGRCQILSHPSPSFSGKLEFLLDGAHTDASMRVACEWVKDVERKRMMEHEHGSSSAGPSNRQHLLLFNCGHVRDPIELMIPLVEMAYTDTLSSESSPNSSISPSSIHFTHLMCTPFDHDRLHLSAAPTFQKLLENYLLPQQRKSNITVASGGSSTIVPSSTGTGTSTGTISTASAASTTAASSINPTLLAFLQSSHSFPSTLPLLTQDSIQSARESIASVVKAFQIASSEAQRFPGVSPSADDSTTTWQHTLFQVWRFLHAAFHHAHPGVQIHESTCIYAASVNEAIQGIEGMVQQRENSNQRRPLTVFVTGSLYLVGNVLQRLGFRV